MRASARLLVSIKPLPSASVQRSTLRLPPTEADLRGPTVSHRKQMSETAAMLLKAGRPTSPSAAVEAEAEQIAEATTSAGPEAADSVMPTKRSKKTFELPKLPDNVRVEVVDKQKIAFWRVPKANRTPLKRLLRES